MARTCSWGVLLPGQSDPAVRPPSRRRRWASCCSLLTVTSVQVRCPSATLPRPCPGMPLVASRAKETTRLGPIASTTARPPSRSSDPPTTSLPRPVATLWARTTSFPQGRFSGCSGRPVHPPWRHDRLSRVHEVMHLLLIQYPRRQPGSAIHGRLHAGRFTYTFIMNRQLSTMPRSNRRLGCESAGGEGVQHSTDQPEENWREAAALQTVIQ